MHTIFLSLIFCFGGTFCLGFTPGMIAFDSLSLSLFWWINGLSGLSGTGSGWAVCKQVP